MHRADAPPGGLSREPTRLAPVRQPSVCAGEPEVDVQQYYAAWNETRLKVERIVGNKVRLEMEPGRYLTGNAGVLVAEIRAVKKVADNHFVLLDAGFSELARPALYGSHHDAAFFNSAGTR